MAGVIAVGFRRYSVRMRKSMWRAMLDYIEKTQPKLPHGASMSPNQVICDSVEATLQEAGFDPANYETEDNGIEEDEEEVAD